MDGIHPDSTRYLLNAQYLEGLDFKFLKVWLIPTTPRFIRLWKLTTNSQSIIKLFNSVSRMKGSWNIGSCEIAAQKKILNDEVSVNWLVVQTPLGKEPHEDYGLDTLEHKQNVDELFRTTFAKGLLPHPNLLEVQKITVLANPITTDDDDGKDKDVEGRLMHKLFLILSDERDTPVSTRAAILFVYGVRKEGDRLLIGVQELVQELQSSSEAIVGSARLAVNLTVGGLALRTSFYMIREEADYLGPLVIPELGVTVADADTRCDYTLQIFLEAHGVANQAQHQSKAGVIAGKKRHFSTRSTDNEEEEKYRTVRSESVKAKVNVVEQDSAHLDWLRGASGYDNAIAVAMRKEISTKQAQPTCAVAIFAAYVYIVSQITPGLDCEAAGRVQIPTRLLADFLGCKAQWIVMAKAVGRLQVSGGDIDIIKAHMDGNMVDSYMGMKKWKEFLEAAIVINAVKVESTS
ncbi:hypothetical protein B0H19DRAFT_1253015 [Mycena capillaripes]|nr:hypothetical protein B0H19DRAFT_1253015 [Mycena capillaripes]